MPLQKDEHRSIKYHIFGIPARFQLPFYQPCYDSEDPPGALFCVSIWGFYSKEELLERVINFLDIYGCTM